MWIPIEIAGNSFLFKCDIDDNSVIYSLSDLKQMWVETCAIGEVLSRAKNMNKRIEYDKETVLNTIKSLPESISIDQLGHESNNGAIHVTLKYHVSDLPFNFEWNLMLCPQSEFLHSITNPLLFTISCLSKKNNDLLEIIRKKDIEIDQYKQEGAVLKRNKVATERFDAHIFDSKYPKIKIDDFVKYADKNFDHLRRDCMYLIDREASTSNGASNNQEISKQQLLKSPKSSKHFAKYERSQRRQRVLAQVGKVAYEDSDSCTPPNGNDELETIKRSLEELKRKQKESDQQNSEPTLQVIGKKPKRKFNL